MPRPFAATASPKEAGTWVGSPTEASTGPIHNLHTPKQPPTGFEDLLRSLRCEHDQLRSFSNSLAAENYELRERLRSHGELLEDKPLPPPPREREERSCATSKWRQTNSNDISKPYAPPERPLHQESALVKLPQAAPQAPPSPNRRLSLTGGTAPKVPSAFDPYGERKTKSFSESKTLDLMDDDISLNDERRLAVCIQKVREMLDITQGKNTVCVENLEEYLRKSGKDSPALMAAVTDIMTRLRDRENRLLKSATGTSFGGMQSTGAGRKPARRPAKAVLQVPLQALAELLLSDSEKIVLSPMNDDMKEVLRLLRTQALQMDTLGFLHFAGPVAAIERGIQDANFDKRLDLFMNIVITVNAICMGVFASDDDALDAWSPGQTSDFIFTSIFLLEALIKLIRQGCWRYFCGSEWGWNFFDILIVALGLSDFILTMTLVSTGSFNTSSFMVLKLLRLGRLLRVLRLSGFRKLRLMLSGIIGLLKTLGCVMIVLLVSVYLIATILVQVYNGEKGKLISPGQEMLFSTVPRSMFTVFRCLNLNDCNAIDGSPVALHLSETIGWPFTLIHSVFSVVMNYGFTSLITALVVDTTVSEAKKAEFRATQKDSHRRQVAFNLHRLEQIFVEAQKEDQEEYHNQQTLSAMLFLGRKTFQVVVQRPEVQKILDSLEIDAAERVDLFDALDADGNGFIEIDELVAGLVRMAGKASRADTVATRLKMDSLQKRFASAHTELVDNQIEIMARLDTLMRGGGMPTQSQSGNSMSTGTPLR